MEVNTEELIRSLSDKITLYQHLGIKVISMSSQEVCFQVDLQKNKNHKDTAFGGSLYATAVLAAYAMVLVSLRENGFTTQNIVIAKGEIKYLRPVDTDFQVMCSYQNTEEQNKFYSDLKTQASARVTLQSKILGEDGQTKAVFSGEFVAKI